MSDDTCPTCTPALGLTPTMPPQEFESRLGGWAFQHHVHTRLVSGRDYHHPLAHYYVEGPHASVEFSSLAVDTYYARREMEEVYWEMAKAVGPDFALHPDRPEAVEGEVDEMTEGIGSHIVYTWEVVPAGEHLRYHQAIDRAEAARAGIDARRQALAEEELRLNAEAQAIYDASLEESGFPDLRRRR